MRKVRKNYSPQEKLTILRRHLLNRVPAVRLCDQFQLQPNIFYGWLKRLFDNGAAALGRKPTAGKPPDNRQSRIGVLQEQLGARESREAEQKWMISLTQGLLSSEEIRRAVGDTLSEESLGKLLTCVCNEPLKYRNRAMAVLSYHRHIRVSHVASFLGVTHSAVDSWLRMFAQHGCRFLLPFTRDYCKAKDKAYRDAVFEILHAPPSTYGINRTTWRQQDIHSVMVKRGLRIARSNIQKIIREAGYRYRKAKRVLTSTDPNYKGKLKEITRTLQNLGPNERFFSIDEYGPFAVIKRGGRKRVGPEESYTVPQWQKSKGHLIITAALELSRNQVTHFYSKKKNTQEMIKMMDLLRTQYRGCQTIYLSWDAASWHISNELFSQIATRNEEGPAQGYPVVKTAPLPAGAQFLNVIESVFSGMARAIIHSSDYQSLDAAKAAIDQHFKNRNEHFRKHPKRAGRNIWGVERVESKFQESNNCKDPLYR